MKTWSALAFVELPEASMPFRVRILDQYILRQVLGAMGAVLAIVMSLMTLEHLPRLVEITRLSGHRGHIVLQSVASLLPEYGGIGLIVGLFLGIALTTRKLALRGELDVIEACGISPLRWMRLPLLAAVATSALTLINQGWLMPAGEARLSELTTRMALGDFGHQLSAGQFVDLGSGNILSFREVDPASGQLIGLFLETDGPTITAMRGRLSMLPSRGAKVELENGQVIDRYNARILEFTNYEFLTEGAFENRSDLQAHSTRQTDIDALWAEGSDRNRSAVYGRCLWAALALIVPILALVLGKPPRRRSGAAGIIAGMILLVLNLKMIGPLIEGRFPNPEWLAAGILAIWGASAFALVKSEQAFGHGFVDTWAATLFEKSRSWLQRPQLQVAPSEVLFAENAR